MDLPRSRYHRVEDEEEMEVATTRPPFMYSRQLLGYLFELCVEDVDYEGFMALKELVEEELKHSNRTQEVLDKIAELFPFLRPFETHVTLTSTYLKYIRIRLIILLNKYKRHKARRLAVLAEEDRQSEARALEPEEDSDEWTSDDWTLDDDLDEEDPDLGAPAEYVLGPLFTSIWNMIVNKYRKWMTKALPPDRRDRRERSELNEPLLAEHNAASRQPILPRLFSESMLSPGPLLPQDLMHPLESTRPQERMSFQEQMRLLEPLRPQDLMSFQEPMRRPLELIRPQELIRFQEPMRPLELMRPQELARFQEPMRRQEPISPQELLVPLESLRLQEPTRLQETRRPQEPAIPLKPMFPPHNEG